MQTRERFNPSRLAMFNLIVSGNGNSWEKEPFTMDRSRFGEYSGNDAAGISLKEPETLVALIGLPTLLLYELGAQGDNVRIARYGSLTNVQATGRIFSLTLSETPSAFHHARNYPGVFKQARNGPLRRPPNALGN